ncbi:hypothetical protein AB0F03_07695 [Streptomyces sp. NPDC028722]|uniref:hypothetical protein n=1 Tax=Streptomyces sp. NPDC028722 TaxID=3155016 RepID=UPI0033FD9203
MTRVDGSGERPVTTVDEHACAYRRDDLVSVPLGYGFTAECTPGRAGVPIRHVEQGREVPMYVGDEPEGTGTP